MSQGTFSRQSPQARKHNGPLGVASMQFVQQDSNPWESVIEASPNYRQPAVSRGTGLGGRDS